jgi:hypothetical protein
MAEVKIAELMAAYATDAVGYAARRLNITLDFSEASLQDVDRILADYSKGELLVPERLSDAQREELWVFCKVIGGYLGEVIIRNIGGQWELRDQDDGSAAVKVVATGGVEGSPPDSVWRSLTEPNRSTVSYYRGLKAVLGRGKESIVSGVRTVQLPPLSAQPPVQEPSKKRAWWKFR